MYHSIHSVLGHRTWNSSQSRERLCQLFAFYAGFHAGRHHCGSHVAVHTGPA